MVRNVPDSDDDDFMMPRVEVAGGANENAKKKEAAKEMGMQALMNIQSTNLNNPMCDWFARLYQPDKREFVIPGRARIPFDEDSLFNTLGVLNEGIHVPYKVDKIVQARLFPEIFPGLTSHPWNSAFANMLGAMQTSGVDFKRKLLMYLISNVFAPTTSLRPSSRCFPILDQIGNVANMNWCKFIIDFLHNSLSN